MEIIRDYLECDDCGHTDDGMGTPAVRQYEGTYLARSGELIVGILCDFCAKAQRR